MSMNKPIRMRSLRTGSTLAYAGTTCQHPVEPKNLFNLDTVPRVSRYSHGGASRKAQELMDEAIKPRSSIFQSHITGLVDEGESEVYCGENKLSRTSLEEQYTDRLRLAIFSKDALDHFERTLERTPPVVSFQVVGRQVVFFFALKIDYTILHCKLSSFSVPVTLGDLDLHEDVFFPLSQVQSLVRLTKEALDQKRGTPLVTDTFPTMGTPNRRMAVNTSAAGQRGEVSQVN